MAHEGSDLHPAGIGGANGAARGVVLAAALLYVGFIGFALFSGSPSVGAADIRQLSPRAAESPVVTPTRPDGTPLPPMAETRPIPKSPASNGSAPDAGTNSGGAQVASAPKPTPGPVDRPAPEPRVKPAPPASSALVAQATPQTSQETPPAVTKPKPLASDRSPASMEGRLTPPVAAGAGSGEAGVASSRPDATPAVNMEFVVQLIPEEGRKFRDLFIESPARARTAFQEFAASHAEFRELTLKHVTYGGACTLVFEGDVPRDEASQRSLADGILDRLNSAASVEYAEPNLVAWRGSVTP